MIRQPSRRDLHRGDLTERWVYTLEGSALSVSGLKLTDLPTTFATKKHNDVPLVDFVTSIDVSVNKLRSLKNVWKFEKLQRLIADHNRLESNAFKDFRPLPSLHTLWLNDNSISDLEEVINDIARVFPNLTYLSLLKNPCTPNPFVDENRDNYQIYRHYIIARLPKLQTLDANPVRDAERKFVAQKPLEELKLPPSFTDRNANGPNLKASVGMRVILEGELMVLKEEVEEFADWEPLYCKLGEGKLVYFSSARHVKPLGVILLEGCKVELVDDSEILSKVPPHLETFKLYHPEDKRVYYLISRDKDMMKQWVDAIAQEASAIHGLDDWDEIEAKRARLAEMQDQLRKQASIIRLKKTANQAYTIDPKEIKLVKVLGGGSFGTVYQGLVRSKVVAVKVIHSAHLDDDAYDDFCNEVDLLSKIHHPNVIMSMGASFDPLMIVTELMPLGDLEHLLLDPDFKLPLLTRLDMAKQAATGMAWLHGSNPMIIHRDVKTSNFLVDEHLRVVVSDFGFAETLRRGASTWDDQGAFKGTIYYVAPEILKNAEFNETCDVYSFGLVLWMIYTRKPLYAELEKKYGHLKDAEFNAKVTQLICFENYRPAIPADCPLSLRQLITDCWSADPAARPSFSAIIERLDNVIFETSITDIAGRQQWLHYFPGKTQVRYSELLERFSSYFEATNEEDREMLREVLVSSSVGSFKNRFVSTEYVTMAGFGRFLDYFGPLSRSHDIMSNVRRVVSQKWFFGDLTAHQAHSKLCGHPVGTFLVRFSQYAKSESEKNQSFL